MGKNNMLKILSAGIVALALPLAAYAQITVESVRGSARAGDQPLAQGQTLAPRASVSTDAGAQVFLKFDDGMQIVLHENSLLRIVDYRYSADGPNDRAVFDLLRGAARVVTGLVAAENPKQFFFRTPQAQFMVGRPSDFTVALVNPAYVSVHTGTVLTSNAAGPATLTQGSLSVISNAGALPAEIAASALPAQASAAMQGLSVASVTAPAGGAAFGSAAASTPIIGSAAATGLVIGGVAAAAALAGGGDDKTTVFHTPTHH